MPIFPAFSVVAALVIFCATYLVVALGRLPGLRLDRAGAALLGASLPACQPAWLTVAMASTLAGNFTLLGSVANLIVAHSARQHRVEISFWRYFRVGAPLTVLTLILGCWWLS